MSEQRKLYCIHGIFPDHCGACQGQLITSLRERVEELMEAQRWIPASERLPEKAGRYLAFFCMRRCALSFRDGRWRYDSEYMPDERQKDVTHWLPLPAPPEAI